MKMRSFSLAMSAAFVILSLTACSDEAPIPTTFSDVCQKRGDRVVIEGYLRLPLMGSTCKSNRCMLNLISDLKGRVESITAQVSNTAKPGSGVNAMEPLPPKFRAQDLRIHANDGSVVDPNTKLRLVGTVQKAGGSCELSVHAIEVARPEK